MPAVLVHGNPETPVIWEPLVAHLTRTDIVPAMVAWGAELATDATVPGLGITASNDPCVRGEDLGVQVADQLGARRQVMKGQGRWWMLGDPAAGAAALEAFWGSI